MSEDQTGFFAGLMGGASAEEAADSVSDETTITIRAHSVSKIRHWRQRYAGPDASYVFRKGMSVRGADGTKRRVRPGDPVDTNDGVSLRRLKALWYSESIELADFENSNQVSKNRTITTRNNRAIRERAEQVERDDQREREQYRAVRLKLRAAERAELRERELAENAVIAAEQAEEREFARMEAEEAADARRVQEAAAILELQDEERRLQAEASADAQEKAAEALEQKAEDAKQHQLREEAARVATDEHNAGKAKRHEEREAKLASNRLSEEEREKILAARIAERGTYNPKNHTVDAKEARTKPAKETSGEE